MILSCQNIAKSFGDTVILKNVSFNIEEHDKAAIIGINGAGKTTLLKIILGQLTQDSGNVVTGRDIRLGYLSQQAAELLDATVIDAMKEAKSYIMDMEKRIRTLEEEMKDKEGDELNSILEAYNRLTTRYDRENGYAYESEITGVLKGLGFSTADYERHINTLSGGQKMRIALGRLLLSHPDIIILDEPTNHLDMPSITWLEGFLSSYPGAVIVVSHDRYFIDRISNKIIEIDQGNSRVYNGSYSYYSDEKAKIRKAELNAYLKQQAEIQHEQAVITKLKQFNREKSIKRAESREKKLDKIELIDKPTEARTDMRLKLSPITESGEDVLHVENLSKSFGTNRLFSDIELDIKRGDHIALIGGNGTGKTTILKIINRMESKDSGTITLGSRVKIGYFDQEHHDLDPSKTIFEEMSDSFPEMNNTKIRSVLAAFLFTGEDVFKKISELSGGERGRLSLAKLMLSPANFLILDEPTNHLDIPSKEILEDALSGYTGTILTVSHDRYFINKVATGIIELRNKVLTVYKGNYDFYEENRDRMYELQNKDNENADNGLNVTRQGFSVVSTEDYAKENKKSSREEYENSKAEYARQRKLANDLKKVESGIERCETRISEIDEEMNRPENGSNVALLTELTAEREQLDAELLDLYEKWEALQS